MQIRVSLYGGILVPAEINQMETLIQETGRQAIDTGEEQLKTSHWNKLSALWRTNILG